MRLANIAKGKMRQETFLKEIREYACDIVEEIKTGQGTFRHDNLTNNTCPQCGKFLIRVRLSEQPDGTIRVSRLTYEATSEAAEAYARRAQKADPEAPSRPRRRRRRGGAKKETEKKQSE